MQRKCAVAELTRPYRSGFYRRWLPGAALTGAIVLGPAGGIPAQQSGYRTSLQATLTVVSGSGSLSVARVAGHAATGSLKTVAIHSWCDTSCIVFIDRDPGMTGSPRSLRGTLESTELQLVTPETAAARLTLPAHGDREAATVLMYF